MNPSTQARPEPTPAERIMMMSFAHAESHILFASLKLGIYAHLAGGARTVQQVAAAAGAGERGTRMLLDVLASFGLLAKQDGQYSLTPAAADLLVPSSPNYVGGIFESDDLTRGWLELAQVIRSGKPTIRVETPETAQEFFPKLVRTLHITGADRARAMAKALGAGSSRKDLQVLDVACGSGVWSIAVAEADSGARVTAQDFPKVLELTRQYAARHGVADRFDYLAGDLKTVDFGDSCFDLAILGNIVHSEGEQSSRDLFRRLQRALRPRGSVVVVDMVPNDDRSGPPFPLIFALNMLLHTTEGDTYTLREYTEWLTAAGFKRVETLDVGSHSPLIIAHKD